MRKILLSLVFLSSFLYMSAQSSAQTDPLAKQLVQTNAAAIGLSQNDLNNYIVSSSYFNQTAGTQMVYLLQGYKGLPVWNQMLVLAFKDGKLISKAGGFLPNLDQLTSGRSAIPSLSAPNAVRSALTEAHLVAPSTITQRYSLANGKKIDFGTLGLSKENVTTELMWVPVMDGAQMTAVKLAWQVEVYPLINSDYWNIRVDASNGAVVNKNNLTVYDIMNRDGSQYLSQDNFLLKNPETFRKKPFISNSSLDNIFSVTDNTKNHTNNPSLVTTVNYTVIKYPAEAPSFPGGTAAIATNPWTLAGGNAATLGWHNDGTLDYTTSRGNNVHAHEDQAANNSNNGIMAVSTTTPDPLNFTYAGQPNYTVQPTTPGFQQFAITNLFYWNNLMHDVTYKYGFDEPAGNFQNSNLGRGGLGSDYVQADAQDGSGTNNANMATPPDGSKPRMQMFLFNPPAGVLTFVVNSPASIAGPYTAVEGAFSTANLLGNVGPRTANLVYYNDQAAATHEACVPPSNAAALNGKIALINRGNCTFVAKVNAAQAAGAIGVVMVNNVPGAPIVMGGADNTITTPAIMISDVDGATIAAQLNNPFVNVTMSSTPAGTINLDGDIDNGVVDHEFFHGVSNRLTGGPATTSCLNNAEEGGEGWSDYNGLMNTTDWSTALITDGFTKKRPIGTYAFGQQPTGGGIRLYPYCTNISINPLTYANMGVAPVGTEVHNIGEIWCMALWEMTWGIIQTDGINPNLFNNAAAGGNSVAYKLVIEGLKLQPCSPGYIDARNAILQADQNLYAGAHNCAIWAAFAKRGMGFSALQGSPNSATDQTPAFDLPPGAVFTTQPSNATTCAGSSVSFTAVATNAVTYQWQVSTAGVGGPFVNIPVGAPYSGTTTSTLTINPAAVGMNGYAYRLVATTSCGSGNSNPAVLTVVAAAVGGTITPANTNVCSVPNSTLLTLSGNVGPVTRWESSTTGVGGPYLPIAGTAGAQTYTATNVAVTTFYRAFISATGCASATSSTASVTVLPGALPMYIVADPGTTVCAGDPTRLTVMEGAGVTNVNITRSSNNSTITTGNSVACGTAATTAINSYWRVYDLTAFPAITGNYTINSVKFAIELSSGGPQNVIVNLYNQTGAAFPGGTRTLIPGASQTFSVPNTTSGFYTATFTTPPTVSNSQTIIVEVRSTGVANTRFFLGSNAAAETSPSYLSAAACGIANPTTTAAIGFPNMHIIVDLLGTIPGAGGVVTGGTFLWSPAAGLSSTSTNPVAASPAITTTYTVQHNNGAGCIRTAQITINVTPRPVVTTNPSNTTVCNGSSASFTAAGTGAGLTYQWQVSTDNGVTWSNIPAGAPYTGSQTATLTINPVTLAMNNYRYRVVLGGTCPPGLGNPNISTGAILTVNALPAISITPAGPVCGGVAGVYGTSLSTGGISLPPVPGTVNATSGSINLAVPDNTANGVNNAINIAGIPANATITNVSVTLNMSHTYPGDMIFNLKSPSTGNVLSLYKYGTGVFTGPVSGNATWGWYGATVSKNGNVQWKTVAAAPFIYNNSTAWQADAINTPVAGAVIQNPAGYVSNATGFSDLYTTGGSANGAWTLAMADGGPGDTGTLSSWSIKIDYTTPAAGAPITYIWTPATGLFTDPQATVPYAAGASAATVYAAPTTQTVYTVTAIDGNTSCSNSASVVVNATPPAPTVTPNPVAMCLGDTAVRLISSSSISGSCTVSSGTISVPVPDNSAVGASRNLTVACVPSNANVTGVRVTFSMPHTWDGDMIFNLKAPNGNILNLDKYLGATGGAGATTGFVNTVISSAGVNALSSGTNPYTGTFKADLLNNAPGFTIQNPTGFVSNATSWNQLFSTPNGVWTLAMADGGPADVGTLTSWSITLDYIIGVPSTQATWTPATFLWLDQAQTQPYVAGSQKDTVYTRPTPVGVYTYSVTVNGINPPAIFSNPAPITINDNAPATPSPSSVVVSNLPTTGVTVKSVTLTGFSHTWSGDVNVVLQSPTGQNVILLGRLGNDAQVVANNVNLTFSNTAATSVPVTSPMASGTYKPTNYNPSPFSFLAPGPQNVVTPVNPANPTLATFTGNMNGTWKLFVEDRVGGDVGNISGGFSITFNDPTPGCTSPARTVVVTVNQPIAITTQPVNATVCTNNVTTFSVVATGTSATYQWQVSTDNGNTFTNITNGGVYSGATTPTLTITAPPVSMNGYIYRVIVNGAAPCASAISLNRTLTVNPLPTIVIAATPYRNLYPGLTTILGATTISPAAATYTWIRNGTAIPGATLSTYTVDIDHLGSYVLKVTDVNGCTNISNTIVIGDSVSGRVFIYPNPNTGRFQVRYNPMHNAVTPYGINIIDALGKRVLTQQYTLGVPYAPMYVDLSNAGSGVYWVEVVDVDGNRLAMGRVEILR